MKKLIVLVIFLLFLTGCVENKPAPKSNPNLLMTQNIKAYPERNFIALKWDIVKNIDGYYIEKLDNKNKKWKKLVKIDNPYKTLYVDTNLNPSTSYTYRIATFKNNQFSLANKITSKTLPTISQVIPLESKPLKKGMVKIIFRPHINERVKGYIIEKFNDKNVKWEQITNLKPRYNVEYIDRGLEDGRVYKYRVIAYTFDDLKSIPSNIIKVSTYPKPPVVMNIKATNNLPKKIVITWSSVKGAKYYKVYKKGAFNYKVIAKTTNTKYVDKIDKDGKIEFYKVTAVTPYETESLLTHTPEVMGETLPPPAKPLVSTNLISSGIEFFFSSPDDRAVKYLIVKKEGSFGKEEKFIVNSKQFLDTKLKKDTSYTYEIYAIDKYGLISNPTKIEVDF
ncbi:MAG TPA: fibronectin type III domain-containing protein [Nautiliaceae bacterium]|nr:fibronectin type III domain-containing protein [Nautiliaceae bacterium]